MKKSLLLILPALMLASCGGNTIDKNATKGVIDCYSIRVTNGGSTVFRETYSLHYTTVYEYKSESGKFLYVSSRQANTNYDYNTGEITYTDYPISVSTDRYTGKYDQYNFSRFVGYLTYENNYLLDLDSRVIDSELKFSEYKYATDPNSNLTGNNKEAYEKAKKGFIYGNSSSIQLDTTETGMERHTYTKFGDDCVITYKAKWY